MTAVVLMCFFFFFQAEDGIRDKLVTGVQTCALPISPVILGPSGCIPRRTRGCPHDGGRGRVRSRGVAVLSHARPARLPGRATSAVPVSGVGSDIASDAP